MKSILICFLVVYVPLVVLSSEDNGLNGNSLDLQLSSNETGTNYTHSNVNETEFNSTNLESIQVEPNSKSLNSTNSTNIPENKAELISHNEHNVTSQGENNKIVSTITNQTLAGNSSNSTDLNLNQTLSQDGKNETLTINKNGMSDPNEPNPVSITTNSTRLNDEGPQESPALMAIGITAFVFVILSAIAFLAVYVKKKRNGLCNYQRITIH